MSDTESQQAAEEQNEEPLLTVQTDYGAITTREEEMNQRRKDRRETCITLCQAYTVFFLIFLGLFGAVYGLCTFLKEKYYAN